MFISLFCVEYLMQKKPTNFFLKVHPIFEMLKEKESWVKRRGGDYTQKEETPEQREGCSLCWLFEVLGQNQHFFFIRTSYFWADAECS